MGFGRSKQSPYHKKALDLGINFFDTANIYSYGESEKIVGRALKDYANRDDIVLATKVQQTMRPDRPNSGGLSRKTILSEIDHSLKRLETDYVDLYIIHRFDENTPIEETMEALHDVVKSEKHATSVRARCMPGSSKKHNASQKEMVGQNSSPCKIITT